ncbi:uncharacterized protein LOC105681050 [Bombus impatiens]|uniref:Uncharacterized protein LOC105681050 n=1 Tax=Bombus impatiens TaxID=132113 RepID=A0A6P3UXY1_BOMIM|nr:uncharacterized protein LOC105681050 [Bombus impatiens]
MLGGSPPTSNRRVTRRNGSWAPYGAPNVNAPRDAVRRLYYGVWESVVLYGAPIWASSMGKAKIRNITKRAAMIRMSTAYRTVSHGALCVVTSNMPTHIKAWLRWKQYGVKRRIVKNAEGTEPALYEEMERLKTEAEDRWRVEWMAHNPYSWTKRLIEDPLIFYRTKRGINYYVMQILTGHGTFNWYRHRIGKETHPS